MQIYEDDVGSSLTHNYVVTNRGPWRVKRVQVLIDWPYEVENGYRHGKHLLYLMEAPQVTGNGYCELNPNWVNPLELKVCILRRL